MTPRTTTPRRASLPLVLGLLLCLGSVSANSERPDDGDLAAGMRGRRLSQTTLDGVVIPSSAAARNPLAGLLSNEGPLGADPTNFLQRAFDSQGKVQQVIALTPIPPHP